MFVLQHKTGTYVAREDVREAMNSKYTFDVEKAKVFVSKADAEWYASDIFAHPTVVDVVEIKQE